MAMQRSDLQSLKRSDLQKLCKRHGLKANLKTEALIGLLEKYSRENQSPNRRVSTRSGTRGLERSDSQMSLDVENNEQDDDDISQPASPHDASQSPELPQPEDLPHVQTRSKKTKDLSRLGVGRPAAAGGSGARSVTKVSTPSKRITRSSGTLKRVSHTPEENISFINEDSPEPVSSTSQSPSHDQDGENTPIPTESTPNDIERYVNAAVQPLKAQIERLGVEVAALRASQAELKSLRSQQSELKHKVQDLSLQLNQYRRASSRSSDKGKTPIHSLTFPSHSDEELPTAPPPSMPPTVAGKKRARDSTASDVLDLESKDVTEEPQPRRPARKRARLGSNDAGPSFQAPLLLKQPAASSSSSGQASSSSDDNAPPRTTLPVYFTGPTTPPPRPVPTNEPAFNMLSTPTSSFPPTIHSFPPEAPPSPSPPSNRIAQAPLLNSRAPTPRFSPQKPSGSGLPQDFNFGFSTSSSSSGLNSFMHPGSALKMPSDTDPLFNFDMAMPIKTTTPGSTMYGGEAMGFGDYDPLTRGLWPPQ
ncbi:hypothetical protein DL96DRAFT_29934 [Flagelloscypha sp. PMI_526]|nr:hypothetical protein DL96DRAFT_29934 [Flagelloscypha sp. PMI_526]